MAGKEALSAGADLTLDEIMARFSTDEHARKYLEAVRWEHGRYCPHCGNADEARIAAIPPNPGAKVRPGLQECRECRQQFTVTVCSVFESSKVPLRKWLVAFFLLCSSKNGFSALQLQRVLGLGSYRTAWFMMHRIRFAMKDGVVFEKLTGTVEADHTFVGPRGKRGGKRGRPGPDRHKPPVVTLVQRGGNVRSMHMQSVSGANLKVALLQHADQSAVLMTDEFPIYRKPGRAFAGHQTVCHGDGEYVRGNSHVNMAEGYFSLLKRGINGVYHHVGKQHFSQYLGEFDFRYNTRGQSDGARTIEGIRKVAGKRLMLRRPG